VFEARRFAASDVARVADKVPGASAVDVALAVIGGALRRYLDASQDLPTTSLVALVEPSAAVAGAAGVMTALHTDVGDCIARLGAIVGGRHAAEEVGSLVDRSAAGQLSQALPVRFVGRAARSIGRGGGVGQVGPANTLVLNVLDEPEPLYAFGARMSTAFGMGPLPERLGLTHVVSRCCDELTLSATACRELMPDPASYAECIDSSFEELLERR
jgi:hypothetical protein